MTFDKSNEKAEKKKNLRPHDIPTPEPLKKFMEQGWAPSPLDGLKKSPATTYAVARRERLSKAFPNKRLVIPAGTFKVRSNDSDYRFRPHSAFAWLTGINGTDAVPESVLVLEPNGSGHESFLFIHPRSVRENSDEFYRNPKHGEFWIGRRMTLEETEFAYDIKVRHIEDLEEFLSSKNDSLTVREQDSQVDELVTASEGDKDFLVWLSEARLVKDKFEIDEMQRAVDATHRGFEDMI
ncbi:MAG: aminopeptidase P N-terminal domain-containing protein, partial [Actinomycetota bacterium]